MMQDEALKRQENAPVWGIFATLLWSLLVGAAFLVAQTMAVGFYIRHRLPELVEGDLETLAEVALTDGTLLAYATILSTIVCSLLILGIVLLKRGARLSDYLAWRKVSATELFRWLGILALLLFLFDLATILLDRPLVPDVMQIVYDSAEPKWLLWLALVVAAPLSEELFFRGFLFQGLVRTSLPPSGAILGTAALWAVIHQQYDLYGILTIFLIGLILGVARYRTGSLLLPMLLHAFSNFVATMEMVLGL